MKDSLYFTLKGNRLSKRGDFSEIPFGTDNNINCYFSFEGKEWVNCKAVAVFETGENKSGYAVPIHKNSPCTIPYKAISSSYFRLKIIREQNGIRSITNTVLVTKEG